VGECRRSAVQTAQSLGFDEERRHNIGIVATEAANNVLLHAQNGELLICPFREGETAWIDLLAIDAGPGILDIGRALEDGFSTNGTAGEGLGAISRLSDESSLYSIPEKGTLSWSRFQRGPLTPLLSAGVVSIPVKGESTCGDGYFILPGTARSLYMVVDGLGHGAGATEAAEEAIRTVSRFSAENTTEIISRSHDALKKTRGAAMSIAIVDHERMVLRYAGVGNVSATLVTGSLARSLVSQNGTLGVALPRVPQEYSYPIEKNTTLFMFTDGLSTKTSASGYPGIQNRHPALVSGLLYRDFSRKRDDATILIAPLGGSRT
jgi:anti-sigma regulatory factor (Ser/Thr protein kinase)